MILAEKVVVVTGSTRGIGLEIARATAREGATVVVNSRSQQAVDRALERLRADVPGARFSGFAGNIGHSWEVEALKAHAIMNHRGIDVWVNNAGVSNGYRPMDEETPEELHDLVTINLIGTMYGCKHLIPYFREHGGYLMNVAGRGWKGEGAPYTAAYASSKAAIASLTRSLAAENHDCDRISINAFVPGMVDTDFYGDEMMVSPRLESTAGNIRLALDAFGTQVEDVGRRAARLIAEKPGKTSGRVYAMLSAGKLISGGAKMAWWGMTGRMKRA